MLATPGATRAQSPSISPNPWNRQPEAVAVRQARVSLPPLVLPHRVPPRTPLARPDAEPCSARRAVIGGAIGAGIGLLAGITLIALKAGDSDHGVYGTGDKIRDVAIPMGVPGTLGFFIADATKNRLHVIAVRRLPESALTRVGRGSRPPS